MKFTTHPHALDDFVPEELDSAYWLHPSPTEAFRRSAVTVIENPHPGMRGWITFRNEAYSFLWSTEKEKWIYENPDDDHVVGHCTREILLYTQGTPGS